MKPIELAAIKYVAIASLLASVLFNHPGILPLYGKFTGRPKVADERRPSAEDDSVSIEEQTQKHSIKSIHLIGERHCGTKWITKTLEGCFGDQVDVLNRYTRWKHWFQYDGQDPNDERNYHDPKSTLVVAMFRNPYDWLDSMRIQPYHSPNHFDLDWKSFVTTPWTMDRGHTDQELIQTGSQNNVTCMHKFPFNEIIPCSRLDRHMYNGTFHGKKVGVNYELKHDGSGQPYDSIVDLRRDKISNFLEIASFSGVASFLPVQFEFMVRRGTSKLITEIENITGLQAQCEPVPPRPAKEKDLDADFIEWVTSNVDWEVEKLIGYIPRGHASTSTHD